MASSFGFRSINILRIVPTFVLIVSIFPNYCAGQIEGGTDRQMQQDFDKIRLDHLCVIAKLMQEYESKTGHFPLARSADGKPVVVVIATKEQMDKDKGRVPIMLDLQTRAKDGNVPAKPERIEIRTVDELTEELEAVLEREITLPVDPQKVPVNKPSVYVYTCYLDVFDVSAFLHNSFPFVRKLGDFNYKVAIGSRSNPESGIWNADELMQQPEFKEFFKTPFNKPGYELQTTIPEK